MKYLYYLNQQEKNNDIINQIVNFMFKIYGWINDKSKVKMKF